MTRDIYIYIQVLDRATFDRFRCKCYVTLEGVGGYMPKRYEEVGVFMSALHNVNFFYLTLLGLPAGSRVRRRFQDNLASISNMFPCIMLITKTGSNINNYP